MKKREQLRAEYAKLGIDLVINDRERKLYFKIRGAPLFVESSDPPEAGAHLTGWYSLYGGIKDAQNVEHLAQRAKDLYRENFADNPQMLLYLDRCEHSDLFVFDEELCVEDEHTECIDGYLLATAGLVSRLKERIGAELSPEELSSVEDMNFYVFYNMSMENIDLMSTYWYWKEKDGVSSEAHGDTMISLSETETTALKASLELYCKKEYGVNCLAFVNNIRAQDGRPLLGVPSEPVVPVKRGLDEQIAAAMAQLPDKTAVNGLSRTAPAR